MVDPKTDPNSTPNQNTLTRIKSIATNVTSNFNIDLERNLTNSNSHFKLTTDELSGLHDPKSIKKLQEIGGIDALTSDLNTDPVNGLSIHLPDLSERHQHYGKNSLPQKPPKSFLMLCVNVMKDKTLIVLSIAAVISLALGLYQTFSSGVQYDETGRAKPKVEWVEGVAIIVAISIVVLVGGANDYNKERQFVKLNAKKEDRQIIVYRSGEKHFISINDLLVGDLVYVETGDIVPADSVLVSGSCECDESSLTGESQTIRKFAAQLALDDYPNDYGDFSYDIGDGDKRVLDSMLISGSKLLSGQGKAIVTAVGTHSVHGKIMMSLRHETEVTPLQARLDKLCDGISEFAMWSGGFLFMVLFFKFCGDLSGRYKYVSSSSKGEHFMDILITAITIVVVAIPEGLPLAVTLALAFSTTRMTKDGNLVRVLKSCETMGCATAICSDKTGTLTENKMKVVRGLVGDAPFDDAHESEQGQSSLKAVKEIDTSLSNNIITNILLNSTAFENRVKEEQEANLEIQQSQRVPIWKRVCRLLSFNSGKSQITSLEAVEEPFVGSKTECALLMLAQEKFEAINEPLEKTRTLAKPSIVQTIPFESSRKWGGLVVTTNSGYCFYIKGASELVFSRCRYKACTDGTTVPINSEIQSTIRDEISFMAKDALRTLSLAHRNFDGLKSWPPANLQSVEDPTKADAEKLFGTIVSIPMGDGDSADNSSDVPNIVISKDITEDGLTLDCIVGIQDPLRPGVKNSIAKCQSAGVSVRMVTGDNLLTAKAISKNCGILTDEDEIVEGRAMEGPVFRKLTEEERMSIVPKLRVLARSSPEDKRILVETLKRLGDVVAVTGDEKPRISF
ncbi:unnamed protein product [Ambrosiozyma monospora]|uniref:Unnamed protein product n=1 Tax=Ambrosiozyma monospora TaxID=43982 RepID=A0ACB5SZR0_AMBMO|nr:unnamed protein product [Ambrosiozyma monospora]